jgi:hypothetical protein
MPGMPVSSRHAANAFMHNRFEIMHAHAQIMQKSVLRNWPYATLSVAGTPKCAREQAG